MADPLAAAVHAAWSAHVAALRTADPIAIRAAYIAALEAERALLLDCGGTADLAAAEDIATQIADERRLTE